MRLLDRQRVALEAFDRVVLALEGELAAGEELLDDRDRLGEPVDPSAGAVVRDARLLVIGDHPAGADAEIEATAGKQVERRRLLGEDHRVAVVVVEDERTNAQRRRRVGGGHQGGDRPDLVAEVVGQVDRGVTHRLDCPCSLAPLRRAVCPVLLNTEPKRPKSRHLQETSRGGAGIETGADVVLRYSLTVGPLAITARTLWTFAQSRSSPSWSGVSRRYRSRCSEAAEGAQHGSRRPFVTGQPNVHSPGCAEGRI